MGFACLSMRHSTCSESQLRNWDNDPDWPERVLVGARQLDAKAKTEGIEAIAPLYGLPVPMKGTMATKNFISSAGVGILHDLRAKEDADFVKLVISKHGLVFGKTNVPEFAGSLVTCAFAGQEQFSSLLQTYVHPSQIMYIYILYICSYVCVYIFINLCICAMSRFVYVHVPVYVVYACLCLVCFHVHVIYVDAYVLVCACVCVFMYVYMLTLYSVVFTAILQ